MSASSFKTLDPSSLDHCSLHRAWLLNASALASRGEAYGSAIMLAGAVTTWTRATVRRHSWWRQSNLMHLDGMLSFLSLHGEITPLQKRRLTSIGEYCGHVIGRRAGNSEHLAKITAEAAEIFGETL
jgi:hypothetical protein